ncbi:MAG TPA: DUF4157 domain-containing protein [Terracidiphilus sp.]|jgi:hypothetical protein
MSGQLYGRGGAIARAPVQAKPKEEKLQAKPKEEKIQGKAKDKLHQRRAEVAASTSGGAEAAAGSAPGLPPQLKNGVESLSGMSMDHVQVHYNSAKPAQLNALAYAQGSDIHVGPGQDQHLPHEAWHVVQQAQGRVPATKQLKDGVAINDSKALEHEADVMGIKAMQHAAIDKKKPAQKTSASGDRMPLQRLLANGNTVVQLYTYGSGTTRKVKVTGSSKDCTFEECTSNSVEYNQGDTKQKGSGTTSPAAWAGWLTVRNKSRNATQMHVVNARWGGEGGKDDGNIFPGSPAENSHHLHEAEKVFDKVCFGGSNGTTALVDCKYECKAAPDYTKNVDVTMGDVDVEDPTVTVKIDDLTNKKQEAITVKDGTGLTFTDGS